MENPTLNNEQSKEEKQKAFWERARKGVLQYLSEQGGKLHMSKLHDFSMNKYLIQHQSFSKMMEGFVADDLIFYDDLNQEIMLTDKGRVYIDQK